MILIWDLGRMRIRQFGVFRDLDFLARLDDRRAMELCMIYQNRFHIKSVHLSDRTVFVIVKCGCVRTLCVLVPTCSTCHKYNKVQTTPQSSTKLPDAPTELFSLFPQIARRPMILREFRICMLIFAFSLAYLDGLLFN